MALTVKQNLQQKDLGLQWVLAEQGNAPGALNKCVTSDLENKT